MAARQPDLAVVQRLARRVLTVLRLDLVLLFERSSQPFALLGLEPSGLVGPVGQEAKYDEPEKDRRDGLGEEHDLPTRQPREVNEGQERSRERRAEYTGDSRAVIKRAPLRARSRDGNQ
jgi:hypothetical protein